MKNMENKIIIMERSAQMPAKCWGAKNYRKFAVVEIDPDKLPEGEKEPKMISERAKGVVRIHAIWDRVHCAGPRSGCWEVIAEAQKLRDRLVSELYAAQFASDFYMHHGAL